MVQIFGREAAIKPACTVVRRQMDIVIARLQFVRQRESREQMPTGTAGGQQNGFAARPAAQLMPLAASPGSDPIKAGRNRMGLTP